MEKLTALLLLPIAFASAFGWGRLLERRLYNKPVGSSAYSVSLGLLVWLALGAMLNHASLALPPALDLILAAGVLLAVLEWRRNAFTLSGIRLSPDSLPALIALLACAFYAWFLLPAAAFNFHDDFYKYLPRAVRMLQTGTLGGNPFDFLGFDGVGMQTYLQGFFIGHLSFHYINAFDAVFCLLLAALLLDALGRQLQIHWVIRSVAVTALLVLNPQYVNVSALYSGIAMIIALSMATLFLIRNLGSAHESPARAAVPIGLFVAAIGGLKVTLLPYAGAYLLVLLVLMISRAETRRYTLSIALAAGLSAITLYTAWAAMAWEKIGNLIEGVTRKAEGATARLTSADTGAGDSYLNEVITYGDLFYGGHIYHYLGFFSLIAVMALPPTTLLYRRPAQQTLLLPATAVGITGLVSTIGIFTGVYGMHVDGLVRYNAPVLIAVLLILGLFLCAALKPVGKTLFRPRTAAAATLGALLVLGTPLVLHAALGLERAQRAYNDRHTLAFTLRDPDWRLMNEAFSARTKGLVTSVQDKIPAGARTLAWVSAPFHFDFRRNPILTLASTLRVGPITTVGEAFRPLWLQQQLQDAGVEFVIWEYNGPRKERGGKQKEALIRTLIQLARTNQIVYKNPNWIVFSVK